MEIDDLKCCGNCNNYEPEFSAGEQPYCKLRISSIANQVCEKWEWDEYEKKNRI